MVIHPSNVSSSLYSDSLPRALKEFLSASDKPYSTFLSFSRLSLFSALETLSSSSQDETLLSLYCFCKDNLDILRRFIVSEFYTGILSDPSFNVSDSAIFNMFGRAYLFAILLNDVRSDLSKTLSADGVEPSIVITSGYRSEFHNSSCGGVLNSNHTKGFAIDVACPPGVVFSSFLSTVKKQLSLRRFLYDRVEFIPYRNRRFIHIAL